ncbi:long-chain-fatty-acid--CoA ligase [Pseudoruegeria sp. HB172150]|uniref:long-chain-fatty-acid--CoA ligase n=1 Tax=Pseudoruegeria sp. HB172150 TaxID=2721164 RepID=UPI0015581A24|nr:long-chain-fatty-acid--CoA ligase [Pseudoruegeria sp. HB172150]
MLGQMMNRPLRVADILSYAEDIHGDEGVISSTVEGGIHRETYREMAARSRQLAKALFSIGIREGDRVATLAWNGFRHMELYYGIPGIGGICHTLNPRLPAEQLIFIVNHAEDRALFLDLTFVPAVEKLAAHFPKGMLYIIMTDRAHMPDTSLPGALCYEELLAAEDDGYEWPDLPEDTAAGLCYTSGTTGNPKGTLYTHRSQVLHAFMVCVATQDAMHTGRRILPVVPLFHANAWGLAHATPLAGASLIMPGPHLDGASLFDLMEAENVFSAWGVPTVWLGLMAEINKRGRLPEGFGEVVIGGSAAAPSLIEAFEEKGVDVIHAWGMTEMSPIGTLTKLEPNMQALPLEERLKLKSYQGRRAFGVEMKIVDEDGTRQRHDGKAVGELFVRGYNVMSGYYRSEESALDAEGWFGTGDVAAIRPDGFLCITDRTKDLIKSGGEWISSIDVENLALAHEQIANCAVIAVPHPKWGERPVLVAVPADGCTPDTGDVLRHLGEHLAKWQLPDDVIYVDSLPLTATGKVSKLTLRQEYADHKLPGMD